MQDNQIRGSYINILPTRVEELLTSSQVDQMFEERPCTPLINLMSFK